MKNVIKICGYNSQIPLETRIIETSWDLRSAAEKACQAEMDNRGGNYTAVFMPPTYVNLTGQDIRVVNPLVDDAVQIDVDPADWTMLPFPAGKLFSPLDYGTWPIYYLVAIGTPGVDFSRPDVICIAFKEETVLQHKVFMDKWNHREFPGRA